MAGGHRNRFPALAGIAASLAAGIALRLSWPQDIEYKSDEAGYFNEVLRILAGLDWPWLGPPISMGHVSPPMGTWILAALGWAVDMRSAPDLARGVQLANAAALLAFVAFASWSVPSRRREPWLWAAALWALNPIAIILERKIWPVSTLPLFTVVLVAAWWQRERRAGAFLSGLTGAVMAQVHVGAGFFVSALMLWTTLYEPHGVRWRAWAAGSALGALPALPWACRFLSQTAAPGALRWPIPSFFIRWATQPFGFGIEYTLGRAHMIDFLAGPMWNGRPTYLIGLLHLLLGVLLLATAVRAGARLRRTGRPRLRDMLVGRNRAAVLINATFWGYGGALTALTALGSGSHRHYLIVAAPVMALWAARTVLFGDGRRRTARAILFAFCLCQAALGLGLLHHIHVVQVIHDEYGPTWRSLHIRGPG